MNKLALPRGLAALALALALAVQGMAGEANIEQFLPADALLTVCYYGDNPDIGKTAIAQLLKEQEVEDWLATVRQATAGANQLVAAFLKVNPASLQPLLACRIGLALMPPGEPNGPPSVLLAARVGKAGDQPREQLNAFFAQLGAVAGKPLQKAQAAGIELNQLGGPAGLCFGWRDDTFLLATSQAILERALAANAPKLSTHPTFERAAKFPGSPIVLFLYDHTAMMERFGKEMPPQANAMLSSLGLNGVRTVGFRLAARERALVGSFFLHTAGERRGLVKALASAPVDTALLRQAPRDAAFAWLSNLDPAELYDVVVAAIDAATKGQGGEGIAKAALAEFEKKMGASLRDDLVGALNRGTLVTTSARSLFPALILSQGLKDGDRFDAALTKLVAQLNAAIRAREGEGAGAELRSIRFGDHTIRYLATPGVHLPIAPCFARRGDRVLFALSPIHLKDYLAFLDAGEPSILDYPGFKEMQPLVPKDATSVAYSDFGESFVALYSALGPFLTLVQAIPGNPVAIDLANMPAARTVRKHMFGAISYSYTTEDMIVDETQSPLGVGIIGPAPTLFIGGIGAGMLLPAWASARGQARNAASMSNMKQISMGLMLHQQDKGALPPNLGALLEAKHIQDAKVFVAPHDPVPPQVGGRPCSYVYLLDGQAGIKVNMEEIQNPAQFPLLWEREPFQGDRRNVAFADGHVESVQQARFEQVMERARAFLKDRAAKGKGGEL